MVLFFSSLGNRIILKLFLDGSELCVMLEEYISLKTVFFKTSMPYLWLLLFAKKFHAE